MTTMLARRLWFEAKEGRRKFVGQAGLTEFEQPLVILGEAGLGKTRLMEWLAQSHGYTFCSARKLVSTPAPQSLLGAAQVLVIDALDEMNTQRGGDSVDAVLGQLALAGYPRFVLACRVADWRSATGLQAISEHYAAQPLELHLMPFQDDEIIAFLIDKLGGAIEAERVHRHFVDRGLGDLLGNPQTLGMVATVAAKGALPDTQTELFERATDLLRREHRDAKAADQPSESAGLDAAGAACAVLILSGTECMSRLAQTDDAHDIPVQEVARLTDPAALSAIMGSRLFQSVGSDRFTYLHRRVAEFLGARWLANKANTSALRRRLLGVIQRPGGVPAALRGLHAWLAMDPALTESVIGADPMGLVEYGDPDRLSLLQAKRLLAELERLAQANPTFLHGDEFRVRSFLRPELHNDLQRLITCSDTPFGLRLLILQTLRAESVGSIFLAALKSIALDASEPYAYRSAAHHAWMTASPGEDWSAVVNGLRAANDEGSLRLALEVIERVGYASFTDDQIVQLARAVARLETRIAGLLYLLERNLPADRIEAVLDLYVDRVRAADPVDQRAHEVLSSLTDFAYHLIARRLEAGEVSPSRLWKWIKPFDATRGFQDHGRCAVNTHLQECHDIRQAIQKMVILDEAEAKNGGFAAYKLTATARGLAVSEPDVVVLLQALDPMNRTDERWRQVLLLMPHSRELGATARAAARPFAAHRPDLLGWIERLANPRTPPWKKRQDAANRKRRATLAVTWAECRREFNNHLDEVRAGEFRRLVQPAQAYLGRFRDIEGERPVDRLDAWLGPDIRDAVLQGFEATLHEPAGEPSMQQLVDSFAENSFWNSGWILVAGLAERFRCDVGFSDLSDECLLKGFLNLYHHPSGQEAGCDGLEEAVTASVVSRGLWKQGIKLYVEAQLQTDNEHVRGLHDPMRNEAHRVESTELALEWLQRYPHLPLDAEMEMVDRLVGSREFEFLQNAWRTRVQTAESQYLQMWLAVGLIVDFEQAQAFCYGRTIEPSLLWDLRARATSNRTEALRLDLTHGQASWIVSRFRRLWPKAPMPTGGWGGDTNPWDASQFLEMLIRRVGNDQSTAARDVLISLRDEEADGYTDTIKIVLAEQAKAGVEAAYTPLSLAAIEAIVKDWVPACAADLQAFMLEELEVVAAKIRSDDVESWRGFFDDQGAPFDEERCRDHLLGLLRQGCDGVTLSPEVHVAGDKEVDITCTVQSLRLPIEIKGQWHRELWTAADRQLDRLYAGDWQADGRGIYLVLWFGASVPTTKKLRGRAGQPVPLNAETLQAALTGLSAGAREGRIAIHVLDVERSSRTS